MRKRISLALCACVVGGVLIAGLWPFHPPRNHVRWLGNKNGVRIDSYGTVLSARPFRNDDANRDQSCSLEIWLAPGALHKGTILAFADGAGAPLRLRQIGENLAIERYVVDGKGRITTPWLAVGRALRGGPVFVTITSGKAGTHVYIDGVRAESSSRFGFQRNDLRGNLVLGTSSIHDSWTGQIMGLAIYPMELDEDAIAKHVRSWTQNEQPALSAGESPEALYLFKERSGNLVHNQVESNTDLSIPAHYVVLHNPFLEPPQEHYRDRWSAAHYWNYWRDVALNVAGFIPVGFCFAAYFCSVMRRKAGVAASVVVGFSISLAVEVLQGFLPTRNSGMTDVVTNTAGTALGTILFCWSPVGELWIAAIRAASSSLGSQPIAGTISTEKVPSIPT